MINNTSGASIPTTLPTNGDDGKSVPRTGRRSALGGMATLAALLALPRARAAANDNAGAEPIDPVEARLRAVAAGLLSRMNERTVLELVRVTGTAVRQGTCHCATSVPRGYRCGDCTYPHALCFPQDSTGEWVVIVPSRFGLLRYNRNVAWGCVVGHLRRIGMESFGYREIDGQTVSEVSNRNADRIVELVLGADMVLEA